jgi:phosphoglycerate dehydrogenase-like enzyme
MALRRLQATAFATGGSSMVTVLLTAPYSAEFIAQIAAVDERIAIREGTPRLLQFLRGELPDDAAIVQAAEQEAAELLRDCEVIVGWGRLPLPAFRMAPALRLLQMTSAGIDKLDPAIWQQVVVCNGNGISAEPIAEHVLMVLLMLARDAPRLLRSQQQRHWDRGVAAREISGMTLAIVGMGAIGGAVARRARALGLRVLALRRSVSQRGADDLADEVYPPHDLLHVLARSDAVVLATPLTPETRGLIGAAELAAMRPGSFLINIARGAVVDEPALIAALQSGQIGGAALDVFAQEPLPTDSPLWGMENVIITPHSATRSDRANERMSALVCENLRRYLAGEPLRNLVDLGRGY